MNCKAISIFSLIFILLLVSCTKEVKTKDEKQKTKIALVIHGGAGDITSSRINPQKEQAYREKLNEALIAGYKILNEGGSSLDAVEKVIKILENSPLFNAGRGAVTTEKGEFELDASIMDGRTLKSGAVAGVSHIQNPITLARLVMDNSPHVFFWGKGAEEFAVKQGLKLVDSVYFFNDEKREAYQKQKIEQEKQKNKKKRTINNKRKAFIYEDENLSKFGTVGCVALDKDGNLAAGTSTGGLNNKMTGRIGDSPIIGAGTYANNNTCAVSCTGQGEYFIRNVVAYDVSALIEYRGLSLSSAVNRVIKEKLTDLGGSGGLIALDRYGNIVMNFNTPGMFRGYITDNGKPVIKMFAE